MVSKNFSATQFATKTFIDLTPGRRVKFDKNGRISKVEDSKNGKLDVAEGDLLFGGMPRLSSPHRP